MLSPCLGTVYQLQWKHPLNLFQYLGAFQKQDTFEGVATRNRRLNALEILVLKGKCTLYGLIRDYVAAVNTSINLKNIKKSSVCGLGTGGIYRKASKGAKPNGTLIYVYTASEDISRGNTYIRCISSMPRSSWPFGLVSFQDGKSRVDGSNGV